MSGLTERSVHFKVRTVKVKVKNPVKKYLLDDLLDEVASKKFVDGWQWMDHIQRVTSKDEKCHFTVTFKSAEKVQIIQTKWEEETQAMRLILR